MRINQLAGNDGSGVRFGALLLAGALVAMLCTLAQPAAARAGCGPEAGNATKSLSKHKVRQAVRCLVNAERGSNLKGRRKLSKAAQNHSSYMQRHNCFAHVCAGEPGLEARLRTVGYLVGAVSFSFGETIASGGERISPRGVVSQWFASPSHRAVLLNPRYRHIGVGVSARNGTAYYTADVATRSG